MKIAGVLATALLIPSMSIPSVLLGSEDTGSKVKKVYDWVCSKPEGHYDGSQGFTKIRTISREEDISKVNFKWRWDLHTAQIIFYGDCKESDVKAIYTGVRQYQSLSTMHSRQYTEYLFGDLNADGILERKMRNFEILQSDADGDDASWFFLYPTYPQGFKNKDWDSPSDAESREVYNSELDYWIGQINEKKN